MQVDSDFLNAIGAHLFAVKRPKHLQTALTGFYYRRLFDGLRAKVTYTIDSYSFSNIGIGISAHFGNVNFYAMADNLLKYQNIYDAKNLSLQFGFNYIFKANEN